MKRQEVLKYFNVKFDEIFDEIEKRGLLKKENISGATLLGAVDGSTVVGFSSLTDSSKLDMLNTLYIYAGAAKVEEVDDIVLLAERETHIMFEMPIAEQPNFADIATMIYDLQRQIYDKFGEDMLRSIKFGFAVAITGTDMGTLILNYTGSSKSLLNSVVTARNDFLDKISANAAQINKVLIENKSTNQ